MRISEYPMADTVTENDVLVMETNTGTKKVLAKSLLGLLAYPVGSIYISYNSKSPASLFGGSWVQIENGGFLRAKNDNSSGGSNSKTLSTAQMPAHTHGMRINWYDSVASGKYVLAAGTTKITGLKLTSKLGTGAVGIDCGGFSNGSGSAIDVTPQYQDVYVWRRTA